MIKESQLIKLGECKRPHGIRGEFDFYLFNKSSSLKKGSEVYLAGLSGSSIGSEPLKEKIQSIRLGNKIIVKIEGVDNRNRVEEMIPFEIFVNRDDLPKLAADEFYFSDLNGVEVKLENGEHFGAVDSTYFNNTQDIVVVRKKNDETLELPLINKYFDLENIENGHIVIFPPEEVEA